MLWCSNTYTKTFDDIIHHEQLIHNLKSQVHSITEYAVLWCKWFW